MEHHQEAGNFEGESEGKKVKFKCARADAVIERETMAINCALFRAKKGLETRSADVVFELTVRPILGVSGFFASARW